MRPEFSSLLQAMLDDMSSADPLYRPTSFWEAASAELIAQLRTEGVESFKSLSMPLRFFVPTYGFPGIHSDSSRYQAVRDALDNTPGDPRRLQLRLEDMMCGEQQAMADYRVFLASDNDSHPHLSQVSESTVGASAEQFVFDDRRYSRSVLNYLLGINFIKQHCDTTAIHRVAEIGGGHGALGEVLLGNPDNRCFYLDIDIPPTSTVATWYLQSVFGVDSILDYSRSRDMDELSITDIAERYRAAVICPWQLPAVSGQIDLFVNFVSFQEMEPEVVANYLQQIDRLKPRYILLRNLREGKQIASAPGQVGVTTPIHGADYDDFVPGYALHATNVLPFGHLTEDGFHSELRLYVRR